MTPNLAIIEYLKNKNTQISYAGSETGLERHLIEKENIPYYPIRSGKLRRYFSFKNFLTPFEVIAGLFQSYVLCKKLKPDIVFSKGGFVAFPVVFGAWLNRIPVIVHESDLSPGLANRLSFPFARWICVTFEQTLNYLNNKDKISVTGTPIRQFLFTGKRERGLAFCRFSSQKPVILVIAGGLGSLSINQAIYRLLPRLLLDFQVIHLCGPGKLSTMSTSTPGYYLTEYLYEELADVFACADLVISRAGSNTLYELLALKKVNLLLPLSKKASRGDQIENAYYFSQQNKSAVLYTEEMTDVNLFEKIQTTFKNYQMYQTALLATDLPDSLQLITEKIQEIIRIKKNIN